MQFYEGLETLNSQYPNARYIEVGPGGTLSNFVNNFKASLKLDIISYALLQRNKVNKIMDNSLKNLNHLMGELWKEGYSIKFSKLHQSPLSGKISNTLPGYAFEKTRCWLHKNECSKTSDLTTCDSDSECYKIAYERFVTLENYGKIEPQKEGYWFVFRDKIGILDKLISALIDQNQKIVVIDYEENLKQFKINKNDNLYINITMNPTNKSHYKYIINYLKKNNYPPSYIIYGWSLTDKLGAPQSRTYFDLRFYKLLLLKSFWLSNFNNNDIFLCTITNGIAQISGSDLIYPENGSLVGALKVIPHEHLNIKALILDISIFEKHDFKSLITFLQGAEHYFLEPTYALRAGVMWKESISNRLYLSNSQTMISDGDAIIITGGLGSLGLSVAKEISKFNKVNIVLVGHKRTKSESMNKKFIQTKYIKEIRKSGSNVEIKTCDVSNYLATKKLVDSLRKKYRNKIVGVVHTASGKVTSEFNNTKLSSIIESVGAKMFGACYLFDLLECEVKFFIMTSSLASIMGDIGRINYCAANSFLDTIAKKKSKVKNCLSINFPGIKSIFETDKSILLSKGGGTLSLESKEAYVGSNQLSASIAASILYKLINSIGYEQVAISKYPLSSMKKELFHNPTFSSRSAFQESGEATLSALEIKEADCDELQTEIAYIFHEILGVLQISIYDSFFNLGGNSFSAINLISHYNNKFNTRLSYIDFLENNSVYGLSSLIKNRSEKLVYRQLVELNNSKRNDAIFMVHPANGGCEVYKNLAGRLENYYKCYGLENYNFNSENKITKLKDLAHYYLNHIKKIICEKNLKIVKILGWSFGAKISLEMASILEQEGHKKIKLFLVDPFIHDATSKLLVSKICISDLREEYKKHAKKNNQEFYFSSRVLENLEVLSFISSEDISKKLTQTQIVLFKAGKLETENIMMEVVEYLFTKKNNNLELCVLNQKKIKRIVCEATHNDMLANLEPILTYLTSTSCLKS